MRFEILGRTLVADDLPAPLENQLRRDWFFPEHQAPASDYVVELRLGPVDPAPWQALPPRQVLAYLQQFEVRAAPDGLFYEDATGRVACRHVPGATRIRLQLRDGEVPSSALETTLSLSIGEAMWCSGLVPLHAAAACLEGQACAFLGPSGRGKSTTLLRTMLAGWAPVAEDIVWCDPERLLVYGWEREVRLLPASVAVLPPHLAERDWPITEDGKVNIPYQSLPGAQVRRGGVPLRRLAVLEREPALPSAWLPISPRDAALALWEATGLPIAQQARVHAGQQIGALQTRVECVRLRLGSTPLPLDTPMPVG
ncbi:hypothetical protein [Deinococcus apachensis]|uniref:hypothetical protein n=1 Tax=Deinococcus apachensis TaxID=309886 RepID=UPI000366125A|nr:hypothetical protein [Deinococcus apachensis]